MVVNHTSYGKLELYDIMYINRDDQSALKLLNESAHGTIKMIRQPKVASASTIPQNNQNGKTRSSRYIAPNENAEGVDESPNAIDTGKILPLPSV